MESSSKGVSGSRLVQRESGISPRIRPGRHGERAVEAAAGVVQQGDGDVAIRVPSGLPNGSSAETVRPKPPSTAR